VAHVAITSLAAVLTLRCWSLALRVPLPPSSQTARRRRAAWLLFLGAFVLMRYLPGLLGAATGERIPPEFLDSRTFYWSIFLLDLAGVVPAALIAAVAVLRRAPAGQHAYYAVVGWFALVPPSVAAMAAVMVVRDDPHASLGTLLLLSAASAAFAVPAVLAARQLTQARE
jgi:hypothetical protein